MRNSDSSIDKYLYSCSLFNFGMLTMKVPCSVAKKGWGGYKVALFFNKGGGGRKLFSPLGLVFFFKKRGRPAGLISVLVVQDLTCERLFCSVVIIRKGPKRVPVMKFIKFSTNVKYLVFTLVSEEEQMDKFGTTCYLCILLLMN